MFMVNVSSVTLLALTAYSDMELNPLRKLKRIIRCHCCAIYYEDHCCEVRETFTMTLEFP